MAMYGSKAVDYHPRLLKLIKLSWNNYMNTYKHTPGPWSVSTEGWLDNHVDLNAPSHGAIAEVLIKMDNGLVSTELAHNAILIAAAPEMLEALTMVYDWLSTTHLRPVDAHDRDVFSELTAIIKKATNS